jgi:hypothetical protein
LNVNLIAYCSADRLKHSIKNRICNNKFSSVQVEENTLLIGNNGLVKCIFYFNEPTGKSEHADNSVPPSRLPCGHIYVMFRDPARGKLSIAPVKPGGVEIRVDATLQLTLTQNALLQHQEVRPFAEVICWLIVSLQLPWCFCPGIEQIHFPLSPMGFSPSAGVVGLKPSVSK